MAGVCTDPDCDAALPTGFAAAEVEDCPGRWCSPTFALSGMAAGVWTTPDCLASLLS
jgi:hypothetical protein